MAAKYDIENFDGMNDFNFSQVLLGIDKLPEMMKAEEKVQTAIISQQLSDYLLTVSVEWQIKQPRINYVEKRTLLDSNVESIKHPKSIQGGIPQHRNNNIGITIAALRLFLANLSYWFYAVLQSNTSRTCYGLWSSWVRVSGQLLVDFQHELRLEFISELARFGTCILDVRLLILNL